MTQRRKGREGKIAPSVRNVMATCVTRRRFDEVDELLFVADCDGFVNCRSLFFRMAGRQRRHYTPYRVTSPTTVGLLRCRTATRSGPRLLPRTTQHTHIPTSFGCS